MKVSIITVCYNSQKFINDAIKSVNNQDYEHIEHVFIDGGSVDSTVNIINSSCTRDRIVHSEPDNGIYDAMNKGLNLCSGDIICFLNSDDVYDNNFVISNIVSAFESSKPDFLWSNIKYVHQNNLDSVVRDWASSALSINDIKCGNNSPHPSFVFKRKLLDKYPRFNTKYSLAADFDYMKQFHEDKCIVGQYFPFYSVRMRLGGATSSGFNNVLVQNAEIIDSLKSSFKDFSLLKFLLTKFCIKSKEFFKAKFL